MIRYVTFFLSIFIISSSYCQTWISANGFWDRQLSTASTSKQWGQAYDIATSLQSTVGTGTTINAVSADTSLFSWSAKTSEYSYLTDTANELSWLSHDSIDNAFAHATTISNQTSRSLFIQSTTYTAQTVYNVFSNSTLYSANTAYQVYVNSSTFAKLYADIIYGNATSYSASTVYTAYINSTSYSATSIYNSFVNSTTYAYQTSLKFFTSATSLSAIYSNIIYDLATSYAHTFASNTAFGVFSSITGSNISYYGSNTYYGNTYYNTALWSGYGQYTSSVFKFGNYGISNGHGYIYWNNAPFIKFLFASTATETPSSNNLLSVYGDFKGTFTGSIDTSYISLYANTAGQSTTALSSDSSGVSGYAYFSGSSYYASTSGRSYNSNTSDNLSWLSKDSISNTYSNATLLSTNQYNANSTYTYSKYTSALSESSTKTIDLINYIQYPTWTAISSSNLDGYLSSPFVDGTTLFNASGSTGATIIIHWTSDSSLRNWSKRTTALVSGGYAEKAVAFNGYQYIASTIGIYRSLSFTTSDGSLVLTAPFIDSLIIDGGSLWAFSSYSSYKSLDGINWTTQFPINIPSSYGTSPNITKTENGFLTYNGSFYNLNGNKSTIDNPYTGANISTPWGIIRYSISTSGNFRNDAGYIWKLSENNKFYVMATTDISMVSGYYSDKFKKAFFGWDEGVSTANKYWAYSYDGDKVIPEIKGSTFGRFSTNGRIRSWIDFNNEIIGFAGGANNDGVIYVRSFLPSDKANGKTYNKIIQPVSEDSVRTFSLATINKLYSNGIFDSSSINTTINTGSNLTTNAEGFFNYDTTYNYGLLTTKNVDGVSYVQDFDEIFTTYIGSTTKYKSLIIYSTPIFYNETDSYFYYSTSTGFVSFIPSITTTSANIHTYELPNTEYGKIEPIKFSDGTSRYYIKIISNDFITGITIDAVSTINILSATTTVNYSQSTIDRLHTNTLSANTANISKIYNSIDTSVYWSVGWPEISRGVGHKFTIFGSQASGNMSGDGNLNEVGLPVNLSSSGSITTTARYYVPIKPALSQYGSTLSVTSSIFKYIWSYSDSNDTTLCIATCYMGLRKWVIGSGISWVGSVTTTLFTPKALGTVSTIPYLGTGKVLNDGNLYWFQIDIEFWRRNASTPVSVNQNIIFVFCSLWGKYD